MQLRIDVKMSNQPHIVKNSVSCLQPRFVDPLVATAVENMLAVESWIYILKIMIKANNQSQGGIKQLVTNKKSQ